MYSKHTEINNGQLLCRVVALPANHLNSISIKTMLVVEDADQKTSPIFAP